MGPKKGVAGAAKAKIKDAHVMLSMALSGRTPRDGDIMSIGLAAFTPADRTIHAVKRWNLQPQHAAPFSNSEVCGFWNTRPDVVDVLMEQRVPAAEAMAGILDFLKPFGKVTLVGNPLMTLYGFLAEAFVRFAPEGTGAAPWGFSGVCAKSFASGVLGVPVKDLGKDPRYVAWQEGLALNALPCNDAAVGAVVYCNAVHFSNSVGKPPADGDAAAKAPADGVTWRCVKPRSMTAPPASVTTAIADPAGVAFAEYPKIFDADFIGDDAVLKDAAAATEAAGIPDEWYVTEKVHGSNLSLWVDTADGSVRVGKRTGFLTSADAKGFFDFDRVVARVRKPAMDLAEAAQKYVAANMKVDAVGHVVIFGELAGGEYGAVARDIRGRRVQAGVQYSPTNIFYAFDVAVAPKEGGALTFLPTSFVLNDAPTTKSFVPSILVAGPLPLAEALKVDAEFPTRVPGLLGLPPVTGVANFAEGVVLRPVHDASLPDGRRAIVKRKHPMFREFQAAGAAGLSAAELVFSMLNRNRVAAVASKRTAAEIADPKALCDLVLSDAMADARAAVTGRGEKFDTDRIYELHSEAFKQALATAVGEYHA
jgi:Rnl2 family RNA ligase